MMPRRQIRPAGLLAILAAILAMVQGCSETVGPEDECTGWYQGFYVLSTPDSLYLRAELDFTWAIPDSIIIMVPLGTIRPDRFFERTDPPGMAVLATVDDAVGGWYTLRAFYGQSERTFEEHVSVRGDFLGYDFTAIEPERGTEEAPLTPTIKWTRLPLTESRIRLYADSLRQDLIFASEPMENADSLRISEDVLDPFTRYFWTLEIYDWQSFVPDCPAGYFYMDFFDNGLLFVGWFTTE
jgi:hypothetical protein